MTFFYLLLLAHLVGDFPLQSDAIFRLKQKSMQGVLLHVAIFSAVAILILLPFLSYPPVWLAILMLSVFHVALDRFKLTIANSSASDRFRYFLLDQALHLLSLWLVGIWLENKLTGVSVPVLYQDRRLLIMINALVIAGFAGSILLFYTEKMFLHRFLNGQTPTFPKQRQRWPGIVVRMIATGGALLGGWYSSALLLLPVFILLHPSWHNNDKPLYG